MAARDRDTTLRIVSFNMRGFQQGCPVIEDLVADNKPDIFLLQERWLTPANLVNFDTRFNDYFSFGSSAMCTLSPVCYGVLLFVEQTI